MTGPSDDPPLVEPPESDDPDVAPDRAGPVGGVLLAAGTGSRFGGDNKLLAELAGEPIVRRAGRTIAAAGLEPRIAVLGYQADRVRAALSGLDFRFVVNPDFEDGQSRSVWTGVDALGDVTGAVFALGDMPAVSPDSVAALVAAYRSGRGAALAAACDGQRGNPVLFDDRYFDALTDVAGDVGGRRILREGEDSVLVETGDPGVLRDVDTQTDLDRLRSR